MVWQRNPQGMTGSNMEPLGTRNRLNRDADMPNGDGLKRGRSPERSIDNDINAAIDSARRRKKRNRWGAVSDNKAAGLMGLPTAIHANMTTEQLDAYTLHLRIEEISQKLRINDVVPADGDRSPSPPPQYDNFGKRVNTREYRYRKRLEDERHKLVERALKTIPDYHPPSDYRRPTKTQEKVYVPVNDYPEINFIGLLIGPRGNTLKKMETESQAKIAIRGKGSVKEGKGRSDAAHTSNQEEDLHCLIMADTEDKIERAKIAIHNVIETAASIPEGQNELKRNQLRELAALNGTLRDDENQACQNCGEIGHRKYDCPHARNFTANIICRVCGHAGHMARDCSERQRGAGWGRADFPDRSRIQNPENDEYERMMQEIQGGGEAPLKIEAGAGGQDGGADGYNGGRPQKPWERGPTGAPAPWKSGGGGGGGGGRDDRDGGGYNPRPWASGGGRSHRDNHGGGYDQGGYGGGGGGGGAPWKQQHHQRQDYGGYNNYGGGYNDQSGGYGYGQQQYGGYGGYQQQQQMSNMAPWQQAAPGGMDAPPPPPPPGDEPPPPPPPPGA
ncbi:MAG: hypothetical protein Q9162_005315 [Coniocarpon cinnabarinum]